MFSASVVDCCGNMVVVVGAGIEVSAVPAVAVSVILLVAPDSTGSVFVIAPAAAPPSSHAEVAFFTVS